MKVFKSSSKSKAVVVIKNVDMIHRSSHTNYRAEPEEEYPQIVVYIRGKEHNLTYNVGEEYTRDQEYYALTKALEELHS